MDSDRPLYKFLPDATYAYESLARGELTGTIPSTNDGRAFQEDFALRFDFGDITGGDHQNPEVQKSIAQLNQAMMTHLKENYAILCFSKKMQLNIDRCYSAYSNAGFIVEYELGKVLDAIGGLYAKESGRINHDDVCYGEGSFPIRKAAARFLEIAQMIETKNIVDPRERQYLFNHCLDGEQYADARKEIMRPFWQKSFDYEWETEHRFVLQMVSLPDSFMRNGHPVFFTGLRPKTIYCRRDRISSSGMNRLIEISERFAIPLLFCSPLSR